MRSLRAQTAPYRSGRRCERGGPERRSKSNDQMCEKSLHYPVPPRRQSPQRTYHGSSERRQGRRRQTTTCPLACSEQVSGLREVCFGSWSCENGKRETALRSSFLVSAISRRKCSGPCAGATAEKFILGIFLLDAFLHSQGQERLFAVRRYQVRFVAQRRRMPQRASRAKDARLVVSHHEAPVVFRRRRPRPRRFTERQVSPGLGPPVSPRRRSKGDGGPHVLHAMTSASSP
jgi:hypothetical protein